MKQKLSLATVHLMDAGVLQGVFDRAVENVLADCEDRPGNDTAREVSITFSVAPVSTNGKTCETVTIDARVTSKVPAQRTSPTTVALRKVRKADGSQAYQGVFSDVASDDPGQGTLDELGNKPK